MNTWLFGVMMACWSAVSVCAENHMNLSSDPKISAAIAVAGRELFLVHCTILWSSPENHSEHVRNSDGATITNEHCQYEVYSPSYMIVYDNKNGTHSRVLTGK
jgi:hypothetical protein